MAKTLKVRQGEPADIKKSGIYGIVNLNDGRVYVGQAEHLWLRCEQHFRALRRGDHRNIRLQRAYHRDGEPLFKFFIIEFCDLAVIDKRETYWIAFHEKRYNVCLEGSSRRGVKASDESKAKMSAARKGKVPHQLMTADVRKRAAATYKERWHEIHPEKQSEETIAKRSASLKAKWAVTPKKIPSDETRKRMSESAKNRIVHGNTKYSNELISLIVNDARSVVELISDYGISRTHIYRIKSGVARKDAVHA